MSVKGDIVNWITTSNLV